MTLCPFDSQKDDSKRRGRPDIERPPWCPTQSLPTRFHGVFPPPPNSKPRAPVTPAQRGKGNKAKAPDAPQAQTAAERRAAMTWAQRLKRVFAIDIETCRACGAPVKVAALAHPCASRHSCIHAHHRRHRRRGGHREDPHPPERKSVSKTGPVSGRPGIAARWPIRLTLRKSNPPHTVLRRQHARQGICGPKGKPKRKNWQEMDVTAGNAPARQAATPTTVDFWEKGFYSSYTSLWPSRARSRRRRTDAHESGD
jgi:hypothetical protein